MKWIVIVLPLLLSGCFAGNLAISQIDFGGIAQDLYDLLPENDVSEGPVSP